MNTIGEILLDDVSSVLDDHKYPVKFTRPMAGGTYDVDTGKVIGQEPKTETAYGVYTSRFTNRGIDGTIVQNQRVFIMDPTDLKKEPQDGDELTKDGVTAKISRVRKVKSGTTIILFVCEVET